MEKEEQDRISLQTAVQTQSKAEFLLWNTKIPRTSNDNSADSQM